MADIKLNLNDFKAVLGRVNDGNVKVNDEGKLVKVNFGGKITSFFRAKVTVTPEENRKLREAFMAAIVNSREGRTLQQAKIDEIRNRLGLPDAGAQGGDEAVLFSDLSRHEIGEILKDVTGVSEPGGRYEAMIKQDVRVIMDRGLGNEEDVAAAKAYVNDNPIFRSAASLAAYVKKEAPDGLFDISGNELAKFVKNNAAQLKELVFGNVYMRLHDARALGRDGRQTLDALKPRTMLFSCALQLMRVFARHSEATFRFGTILPQPPNAIEELQRLDTQDMQLVPFRDQLAGFDAFIDSMFVPPAPEQGRPPSVNELRLSSANVALKLEIRNAIVNLIARNGGDIEQTRSSDAFKTIRGLLRLSGEAAGRFSEGAMKTLRERFFRAVADITFREEHNGISALFGVFAKTLGKVTAALDPETQLREGFKQSGCEGDRFEQLRSDLMLEGRLDQNLRISCERMGMMSLSRLSAQIERPGVDIVESNEYVQLRESLAEAFKAANTLRMEDANERKALIDNFCHATDSSVLPAWLNGESHKTFRSKFHLMSQVLTLEQCIAAGLPISPNNSRKLDFVCLGNLNSDPSKLTEEFLEANGLRKALEDEVAECGRKLDELFKHVSAQEIKARKQYVLTQAEMWEHQLGGGKTKILDAMRDRLIPDNVSSDVMPMFVTLFYSGEPNVRNMDLGLSGSDIKSMATMKAEFHIRLEFLRASNPLRAREVRQELNEKLSLVEHTQYPNDEARQAALLDCYSTVMRERLTRPRYTGFGSQDVVQVIKTLGLCGIDVAKLSLDYRLGPCDRIEPPDLDRALALMELIKFRGGNADGIAEWYERVSGKRITELSRMSYLELCKTGAEDPLDKIKEDTPLGKVVRFFKGEYSVGQAGMGKSERIQLSKALSELSKRMAGDLAMESSKTVRIGGVDVRLDIDVRYRHLTATVTVDGRELPIAYPMDIGDMGVQLQNDILDNLGEYLKVEQDRNVLLGILPDANAAANNISRAREICVRVIAKITGRSSVDFASYTMDQLRDTAAGLIRGDITKDSLNPGLSQSYNSQEAIELGASMLKDEATMSRISWSTVVDPPPPLAQRERVKPSVSRIRDFAADLVMNRNTWTFDVQSRMQPGERIFALLKGYAPEIRYLMENPGDLDVIDERVRGTVKAIVIGLRTLAPNIAEPDILETLVFADHAQRFVQIEEDMRTMINSTMNSLQGMITQLFVGQRGVEKSTWQRTSKEINGTGGLDVTTPQGRFIKDVLDGYFSGASDIDKRAMLSAFIRNTGPGDTDGKLAGELIKGAGPLLQKMLQGLPVETFPPETQAALADTRSNLSPIPREVVDARLANMITSSNGFITRIEVKESIGAASVGEALLCRIYTKDHPCTGEEVVIKILRPNVETAARREYELISRIAASQQNGMEVSFADRYRGILDEFDFTIEAGNIDRGAVYNHARVGDYPAMDIESMGRCQSVLPTTGALVLQKAEGQPFSKYTRDARKKLDEILDGVRQNVSLEPGGKPQELLIVNGGPSEVRVKRMQLDILHNQVLGRRKQLSNLVRAWFQQAFEGGFVHGDMHSGNIMTSPKGTTIIDFGNCVFLSEKDRNAVLAALAACVFGEAVDPDNPGMYLMKCLETLSGPTGAAAIANAENDKDLQRDLKVALTRGAKTDVVTRLLSSLTLLQNRGVPLPESITVFTQSLSRLQAAISDTDELLSEIEEYADAVQPSQELKDRFGIPGELSKNFQYFADLDRFLIKSMGDRDVPSEKDEDLRDRLSTRRSDGGAEILEELRGSNRELLERNGGMDFIDMVLDRYGPFELPHRSSYRGVEGAHVGGGLSESLLAKIDAHRRLVQSQASPEEISVSRDVVLKDLLAAVANFAFEFVTYSDHVDDYDTKVYTFEECGYLALSTVLDSKLAGATPTESLANASALFLGSLGVGSGGNFALWVGKGYKSYFAQIEGETDKVKKVKSHCSDHTDRVNFVNRRSRRLLKQVARDMLVPPEGIKSSNLNDVIDANLAVMRKSLGKEALTLAEMRYFVRLVEQQIWKPVWGWTGNSYVSPFKNLDKKAGAAKFLVAMFDRQNEYLRNSGHADLVPDGQLTFEDEVESMKSLPEFQPPPNPKK